MSDEELDLKQRMMELAPALRRLPPGTQVCYIQDGDELLLFNVNKAFELTQGREPTALIDVARLAALIQPRGGADPPDDKALVDPEHALTVDISYPVLLLEGQDELDGTPGRVIDGWHRIYRAAQLGVAELPAVVITTEEEHFIRIDPGTSAG